MKIEDDFLDQREFDKLQTLMMGALLDWHYADGIDFGVLDSDGKIIYPNEVDKNKFQFAHIFYFQQAPSSPFCENLAPMIDKLNALSLFRIKANLLTKTPNIIENAFHVDMTEVPEEKAKQLTISIFYVNTNNGYTEFEDGTKVESVANRLITFPANLRHRGTSCTDEKRRIVINFNYFSRHLIK